MIEASGEDRLYSILASLPLQPRSPDRPSSGYTAIPLAASSPTKGSEPLFLKKRTFNSSMSSSVGVFFPRYAGHVKGNSEDTDKILSEVQHQVKRQIRESTKHLLKG